MHLVVAGRVEPPQAGGLGGRPVLQVGARLLEEPGLAAVGGDLGVQGVQLVVQGGRELAGGQAPRLPADEPRKDGISTALPARSSRQAGWRSRSAAIVA